MNNKFKIIILNVLVLLILSSISIYSQNEVPCSTGDCTGEWQERVDQVWLKCCWVNIYSKYRYAYCPAQTPPEQYQFHIDYWEGTSNCNNCFNFPNDTSWAGEALRAYILKVAGEIQNADMFYVGMASCWSDDLLGPFPTTQPCNNVECCRKWYGVENGIVWYIGDEDDLAACFNALPGVDCYYACDPNGYLYKKPENDEELTGINSIKFEIIPNPSDGKFIFSAENLTVNNVILEITNLEGSVIYSQNFKVTENTIYQLIELKNIINGTYTYRISSLESIIATGKFIISK